MELNRQSMCIQSFGLAVAYDVASFMQIFCSFPHFYKL